MFNLGGACFFDTARSGPHWEKAKKIIRAKGSGLVFEIYKQTLGHTINNNFFLPK